MTNTEKLYTAALALFLVDFEKPEGLRCINNTLAQLGIRDINDLLPVVKRTPKEDIYRLLRNMNREDKKLAQQYLLRTFLGGGKTSDPQIAFIFNEIITECGMVDKQI